MTESERATYPSARNSRIREIGLLKAISCKSLAIIIRWKDQVLSSERAIAGDATALHDPMFQASAFSRAYSPSLTFVPMDFLRNTGFTMRASCLGIEPRSVAGSLQNQQVRI
jgi:hypothetical protein